MNLNPPETAPKNGTVILASFAGWGDSLTIAFWDELRANWFAVEQVVARNPRYRCFDNRHYSDSSLRGWLYMLEIDTD